MTVTLPRMSSVSTIFILDIALSRASTVYVVYHIDHHLPII